MTVLGKAIANYLSNVSGLSSVALPGDLGGDMEHLVTQTNSHAPNRALLVVESEQDAPPTVTSFTTWAQLLEWRTNDDRVFVWQRGLREPDTSFQSVVKPFIADRFPGDPSGSCTLELLAQISIEEVWREHINEDFLDQQHKDTKETFTQTCHWIALVLHQAFELVGNSPSIHWSDSFLVHWSKFLELASEGILYLVENQIRIEPRHAWELIKMAGLPSPTLRDGNVYLDPPDMANANNSDYEKYWQSKYIRRYVKEWNEIVQSYFLVDGERETFLSALDEIVPGTRISNPWRGMNWTDDANSDPEFLSAPEVGHRAFKTQHTPSLFQDDAPVLVMEPSYWWGVNYKHLLEAKGYLNSQTVFEPVDHDLIEPVTTHENTNYLLHTRHASISVLGEDDQQLVLQLLVHDLSVRFKSWGHIIRSITPPQLEDDQGAVWLTDEDARVQLTIRGRDTSVLIKKIDPEGSYIRVDFEIQINVPLRRNSDDDTYESSWNPLRKLEIAVQVHDHLDGQWNSIPRELKSSLKIIIPSPFSLTTVLYSDRKQSSVILAPDSNDSFRIQRSEQPPSWTPFTVPEISLKSAGNYSLLLYDGRVNFHDRSFIESATVLLEGDSVTDNQATYRISDRHLDDGMVLSASSHDQIFDVVLFRTSEQSTATSSGIIAAIEGQPRGQKPPSASSRSSILGRIQGNLLGVLENASEDPNSLFQYIALSNDRKIDWEKQHDSMTRQPTLLLDASQPLGRSALFNGAHENLFETDEWFSFMDSTRNVLSALDLSESDWLSSFNPLSVSVNVLVEYIRTHRELINVAKAIDPYSEFFASYPFSVILVNGEAGATFGELQAVLISPLHPVRLAWAYSVAFLAQKGEIGTQLIGLAEGWNIPATGKGINIAGRSVPMVAVPIDPGTDQDFVSWSAIAVLQSNGLTALPASVLGLHLPWSGQTGINDKVIARAIEDYLKVHPYLNSLQIDLRSISQTPRSKEIDVAILNLIGSTGEGETASQLGGTTRVWDSAYRQGKPPTRDELYRIQEQKERDLPFEWIIYHHDSPPSYSDIAFVENSNVHLSMEEGKRYGLIGLLPLRRFYTIHSSDGDLVQYYQVPSESDLLGLSELLNVIEYSGSLDAEASAIVATPNINGLGVARQARWEILGTFNLTPSVLSKLLSSDDSENRLLWEWRPAWLGSETAKSVNIAKRPYYVIGKVPQSLLKALQLRQSLTEAASIEVLQYLGTRGIGLNTLNAVGGTQEQAAMGLFYAMQLIMPDSQILVPTRWMESQEISLAGILPIDPVEALLDELGPSRSSNRRADLLVFSFRLMDGDGLRLCCTPVEVKHHGRQAEPERDWDQSELRRAREQLSATAELIATIADSVSRNHAHEDPAGTFVRLVGISSLVDLALSFSPLVIDPEFRFLIMNRMLSGSFELSVTSPLLLYFAPGTVGIKSTYPCISSKSEDDNWDIYELYIDPAVVPGLWWREHNYGKDEQQVRDEVDRTLIEILSSCSNHAITADEQIREHLVNALSLSVDDSVNQDKRLAEGTQEKQISATRSSSHNEIDSPDSELGMENSEEYRDIQPSFYLGTTGESNRWTIIGQTSPTGEYVAMDLDQPKSIGIFGYMGSGKSYLLGNIVEAAVEPIANINQLSKPLAVVLFNYRRNAIDRFELSSLAFPNTNPSDIETLQSEYSASTKGIQDIHIVCLPGELTEERLAEYADLPAHELFFDPEHLSIEDWELLMGEPGSNAVFARTIRHVLRELRTTGDVTLERLEDMTLNRLKGQSKTAAALRFDFVRSYLSTTQSIDFQNLIQPGRVVVFDLRQPLFNKSDALRFFLVCSNYISRIQGEFNKLIVFDEAHEYLSEEFGEKIESRIRLMRHEGSTYVFATQDVGSIPANIRRFITTKFVFSLGTHENVEDLTKFAPDYANINIQNIPTGECIIHANESSQGVFARPRRVKIRPRVTLHGGTSRIFNE